VNWVFVSMLLSLFEGTLALVAARPGDPVGLNPIVPPRRKLTPAQRADRTVEEAKQLYIDGSISLERLAAIAENEYRPFFDLAPLPSVVDPDALEKGGPLHLLKVSGGGEGVVNADGDVVAIIPEPVEFVSGDGSRWSAGGKR
jgi:hypothetical protein